MVPYNKNISGCQKLVGREGMNRWRMNGLQSSEIVLYDAIMVDICYLHSLKPKYAQEKVMNMM
jgi:hypothetical protein